MRKAKKGGLVVAWGRVFGLALAINLVAGALWSPALAVRRVVIEGAQPGKAPSAVAALAALRRQPVMRVDAYAIESAALGDTLYASADFRRSVVGVARLKLVRREPLAVLVDDPDVGIDIHGVVFKIRPEEAEGLPKLKLPGWLTVAAIAAPVELGRLAVLSREVRLIAGDTPLTIEVQEQGGLCLNMQSVRVLLGTGEELEAKLATLREILGRDPSILGKAKTINLMAPLKPKAVYRTDTSPDSPSPQTP